MSEANTTTSTPTTTASSAAAGTNPAAATAPAAAADWTSGLSDDVKGYVQNKGFKDPAAVLESYRNMEKLVGASPDRIVKLPVKDDDAEGWSAVFDRLGRPKEAKEYGIKAPTGLADDKFVEWAQGTFHELGLSKKQAESLVAKWNEHMTGTLSSRAETYKAQLADQEVGLKKEWGAAFDKNLSMAKRAAAAFGIDGATIDKMEESMGFAAVMKHFHSIGTKLGEDNFVAPDGKNTSFSGVMSPAAAQQRIATLRGDSSFVAKYASGDAEARAEMERLHKFAYPAE